MRFLAAVSLSCLLTQILTQAANPTTTTATVASCPDTEFFFLLDQSENARRAASTIWNDDSEGAFTYLKDAIKDFLEFITIQNDTPKFRFGAVAYSSSGSQVVVVPKNSTVAEAKAHINEIGAGTCGGSWTHRGLQFVVERPSLPNNRLVVLSSQGSSHDHPLHLQHSKSETDRVTGLGWTPFVIELKGINQVNEEELKYVNLGKAPIVLQDEDNMDPKSYRHLATHLRNMVREFC